MYVKPKPENCLTSTIHYEIIQTWGKLSAKVFDHYTISAPLLSFDKVHYLHDAFIRPLTRKMRKNVKKYLNLTLGERMCNDFSEKQNTNAPNLQNILRSVKL